MGSYFDIVRSVTSQLKCERYYERCKFCVFMLFSEKLFILFHKLKLGKLKYFVYLIICIFRFQIRIRISFDLKLVLAIKGVW